MQVLLRELALVLVVVAEKNVLLDAGHLVLFEKHGVAGACRCAGNDTLLLLFEKLKAPVTPNNVALVNQALCAAK